MDLTKQKIFHYLHYRALQWYCEINNKKNIDENDFSILKSMKLLFFVVSVNCEENQSLLDYPFKDFVAMPYGHVELEVYDSIKKSTNINVTIDNRKTVFHNDYIDFLQIDIDVKSKIDNSIRTLRLLNNSFVNYSAFELVELSHKWDSWNKYFSMAKENGLRIESIPPQVIKEENKLFVL